MTWLFVANILLVLVDASIGYLHAPRLVRLVGDRSAEGEPGNAAESVRQVRRLLTGVVSLYMFFNCLAYFRGERLYLLLVTGFILLDAVLVLYVSHRYGRGADAS